MLPPLDLFPAYDRLPTVQDQVPSSSSAWALEINQPTAWEIPQRRNRCCRHSTTEGQDRLRFASASGPSNRFTAQVSTPPRSGRGPSLWQASIPQSGNSPFPAMVSGGTPGEPLVRHLSITTLQAVCRPVRQVRRPFRAIEGGLRTRQAVELAFEGGDALFEIIEAGGHG